MRCSRRFGPLEQHVLSQFAHPDNPDVFLISNVKEKGKPIGAIRAGQFYHGIPDCPPVRGGTVGLGEGPCRVVKGRR